MLYGEAHRMRLKGVLRWHRHVTSFKNGLNELRVINIVHLPRERDAREIFYAIQTATPCLSK
jgi:hypothetical protein